MVIRSVVSVVGALFVVLNKEDLFEKMTFGQKLEVRALPMRISGKEHYRQRKQL